MVTRKDVKDVKPVPEGQENVSIFTGGNKYWKTDLKDKDFLELYEAHGIAFKVTNRFVNDLTDKNIMFNNPAFDKVRVDLKLDKHFNWAYNRAYIMGYSLLYLGFTDGGDFKDAYEGTQVPELVSVIPKTWIKTDILDKENKNPDHYEIYNKDGTGSFLLHKSRVLRIQLREDSKSMLLPAYRSLYVADNVLWSTGQAIFRQAAGLTHLQIKNPQNIPLDGKNVSEVQFIKQKGILNNINAETSYVSDDRHTFNVHGVQGNLPRPMEYWQIALQSAAMALNVPWQLILGGNAGVVTGSELNQKDYYAMVQDYRQVNYHDNLQDFAAKCGFTNLKIEFGTLFEETDTEKSAMLKADIEGYVTAINAGLISKESANAALNKDYPGYDFKLGQATSAPGTPGFTTNSADAVIGSGTYAPYKLNFWTSDFTIEQALQWAKDHKYTVASYSTTDFEHELIIRPRDMFVPGTLRWVGLEHSVEMYEGELVAIKADAAKPVTGSKWERKKFTNWEQKFIDSLLEDFYNEVLKDFDIYQLIKGSVQYFDSIKNVNIVRDFAADAEKDVRLVIESKTAKFRETAKLKFAQYITDTWGLGVATTNNELADKLDQPVKVTERAQQLLDASKENVMSLVTGASEDMKKDLTFTLTNSLINEEGPRQAAKAFKSYVDEAFANAYKNRLTVIARTETLRTLNQANVQAYKDSGVVDKIEWVTAGDDRVRPSHRAANGEVVQIGKQFSLGVTQPPEGVQCRCSVVPYFGK